MEFLVFLAAQLMFFRVCKEPILPRVDKVTLDCQANTNDACRNVKHSICLFKMQKNQIYNTLKISTLHIYLGVTETLYQCFISVHNRIINKTALRKAYQKRSTSRSFRVYHHFNNYIARKYRKSVYSAIKSTN